jgi:hypothetical protein
VAVAKNAASREQVPCTVDPLRVTVFGFSPVMRGMLPTVRRFPILLVRHVRLETGLAGMKTVLPLIVICLNDWEYDVDSQKLISR